jgi:hypothetical protein
MLAGVGSGKCLEVAGGSAAAGARLDVAACTAAPPGSGR